MPVIRTIGYEAISSDLEGICDGLYFLHEGKIKLYEETDRIVSEYGVLKLNRERQITVLISSHILDELSRLATHYGIIDNGRMVKELSAEELDAACRKCVRMEVSDTAVLARVLDSMNLEYKIISATTADVYAKVNVTQLTVALAKENCEVLSMQEKDESLESYYISLVGGGSNA